GVRLGSTQGYPRRDGVPDGRPYRRPPSGRGGDGRRGRRGAQGEGRSVARGRELRTPERRDDLVSATQPLPRHPLPRGDPVTDHPIDTEALRARAEHVYRHGGPANAIESLAANVPEILDRLAAAEHHLLRAEAERDRWWRKWCEAEAERDGWRQTALDERGAALDALEQIKARDARIKAVQDLIDQVKRAAAKAAWDEAIEEALDGWTIPASGDIEAVRYILLSTNPYIPEEAA